MPGLKLSVFQILAAGGLVLVVLVVLSVYSIAVVWERWSYYSKATRGIEGFLKRLKAVLEDGDLSDAVQICQQYKGVAGRVVLASLVGPTSREDRRRSTERQLEREVSIFHKRLPALATIASSAPFIGLFGTVLGVMRAFRDLASVAGAGPGVVATGIAEALVNTAAGLFVAVPAIVFYNYFNSKTLRFADEVRWVSEDIIQKLSEKK